MATAYATIASGGVYHRPTAITKVRTADGEYLEGQDLPKGLRPFAERRFQDGVTAKATEILEDNVEGGTGTRAQIGCPAAGKTGTTDKHSDGWFVGFTPRLSTAVWVGYPTAQIFMTHEYHGGPVAGGTFPAEIWGAYMKQVKGKFCGEFPPPKEPMTFTKFFGKYATGRGGDTGGYDSGQYTTPTVPAPAEPDDKAKETPSGGGSDDGTYDPDLYESPPQESPGNGNGNGNGAPQGGAGAPPDDG
jgi:penicillin-binding protein 1A